MLIITSVVFLANMRNNFSAKYWYPWLCYISIYLFYDFSFIGLQLTLQYSLPVFIGIVASGFTYNKKILVSISKRLLILCSSIYLLFLISITFRGGFLPNTAAVPMTLSIVAALSLGIFYITRRNIYLIVYFSLLLVPVVELTRMGILAFLALFVFHFGERRIGHKLINLSIAIPIGLLIFFSEGFQRKTFFSGSGQISDITLDYYDNDVVNTSGRGSWKSALEEGLNKNPILGNGPRSDNEAFKAFGFVKGEAHNDFMSIRYNYGYVGLLLLLSAFLMQIFSLYKRKYHLEKSAFLKVLWSSTMVLFIVFLLFMYSDNILKYTIYFPDIFFAMIGILYAPYIVEKKDDQSKVNEIILLP